MAAENGGPDGKPKLSKRQLQNHGIDFEENIFNVHELDSWLQPIGRAITRIQENITEAARERFDKELEQFYLHGQDRDAAQTENWCLMPAENPNYLQRENYTASTAKGNQLKPARYRKALKAVRHCRMRNENEDKWTQILVEHVFWDFEKTNEGSTSYEQRLKRWELQQNVLWNEFPQWAKMNSRVARVTQPKPDLTYGFPVIPPNDELFSIFEGDGHVESFSLPVLAELRNRGAGSLISAPTTALHNWATKRKAKSLEAKDLMCFPWAIVEIKRGTAGPLAGAEHETNKVEARAHKRRTQFCYCQAANASAAGLTLRERLAASAKDNSKLRNARAMFSFTCVGSAVKLWVTYREDPDKCNKESQSWHKEGRIIMVCIWATSIELSWGIMALRRIVKNVRDWVYTRVKPEVARWIHDVRQTHLQTYSLTAAADRVLQRRRAVSCGPTNEAVDFVELSSPTSRNRYRTPHSKARPTLPHGETAPGSLDRRVTKFSVPEIQVNGSTGSDDGGVDDSSDEGYASNFCSLGREAEEHGEKNIAAFIVNDEPSDDDTDASYVPSSSEDESTESDSVEDEESDDYGASSSENFSQREDHNDEYEISDSERHYYRLNRESRTASRSDVYCTPSRVYKLDEPADSKLRGDRRRSWRF